MHPRKATGQVDVSKLPVRVTYGDKFYFHAVETLGARIQSVDIKWRYTDEPIERVQTMNRIVP